MRAVFSIVRTKEKITLQIGYLAIFIIMLFVPIFYYLLKIWWHVAHGYYWHLNRWIIKLLWGA